ncbi:hypothetical protein Agub_g9623, partial [Astrephomene gubernaculifera]
MHSGGSGQHDTFTTDSGPGAAEERAGKRQCTQQPRLVSAPGPEQLSEGAAGHKLSPSGSGKPSSGGSPGSQCIPRGFELIRPDKQLGLPPHGALPTPSPPTQLSSHDTQPAKSLKPGASQGGAASGPMPMRYMAVPPSAVQPPCAPPSLMPSLCQLLLLYLQRVPRKEHESNPSPNQSGDSISHVRQNGSATDPHESQAVRQQQPQQQHQEEREHQQCTADAIEPPPIVTTVRQLQLYGLPAAMLLQAVLHLVALGAVSPAHYQAAQAALLPDPPAAPVEAAAAAAVTPVSSSAAATRVAATATATEAPAAARGKPRASVQPHPTEPVLHQQRQQPQSVAPTMTAAAASTQPRSRLSPSGPQPIAPVTQPTSTAAAAAASPSRPGQPAFASLAHGKAVQHDKALDTTLDLTSASPAAAAAAAAPPRTVPALRGSTAGGLAPALMLPPASVAAAQQLPAQQQGMHGGSGSSGSRTNVPAGAAAGRQKAAGDAAVAAASSPAAAAAGTPPAVPAAAAAGVRFANPVACGAAGPGQGGLTQIRGLVSSRGGGGGGAGAATTGGGPGGNG